VFSASGEPSTQVCAPVLHAVRPCLQAVGFVVQELPAVHATQLPPLLHTMPMPQGVPGEAVAALSTHCAVPLEQLVMPALQGLGFPVHAVPCMHEPQFPALHVPPGHGVPLVALTMLSAQA
jgi:hypothetical protein